jgi:hypothetical protein
LFVIYYFLFGFIVNKKLKSNSLKLNNFKETIQFKMANTFSNIALYIKRAELSCTKEYIIDSFFANKYGKVKDIKFINKTDNNGNNYNGVIVTFDVWFMNEKVTQLLNEMNSSKDGTTKLIHNHYTRRFWFVQEYKTKVSEISETILVNSDISDTEKIKELEQLVRSMEAKMYAMQLKLEKNEQKMMEYEHEQTRQHLHNGELRSQLLEKDMLIKWIEEEKDEIKADLERKLTFIGIDYLKKEKECEHLKQQIYDQENIIMYVQKECQDMSKCLRTNTSLIIQEYK